MCLENFKQLEKLGCDIITLTTSDALPEYIYEKSKMVIHDYSEHVCHKKYYYDYYKQTGFGYFFWTANPSHKAVFFQTSHFPSLLRNTRTLIEFSKSLNYDNYFFIEDDHYIDDKDFDVVHRNFKLLDENDLIVYSFDRYAGMGGGEHVYCSYLHFGRCDSMQKIVNKFAYTSDSFVNSNPYIYLQFYECMFRELISQNTYENFKVHIIEELISNQFKNSKLNMVYSYNNVDDDCRCSIIRDIINNKCVFYYDACVLSKEMNLKVIVNKHIISEQTIYPGTWFFVEISDVDVDKTEIVIDNKIVKSFKQLNLQDVIYNGEMTY